MSIVKCVSETWQGDARVAGNEITSRRTGPDLEKSLRPGLVGGGSWIRTLGTAPLACQMNSCTEASRGCRDGSFRPLQSSPQKRGKLTVRPFREANLYS